MDHNGSKFIDDRIRKVKNDTFETRDFFLNCTLKRPLLIHHITPDTVYIYIHIVENILECTILSWIQMYPQLTETTAIIDIKPIAIHSLSTELLSTKNSLLREKKMLIYV